MADRSHQSDKKGVGTLYISNLSEDVWPFIVAMADTKKQNEEIKENALLSDRDLLNFADQDNIRLILPCLPEPGLEQSLTTLFGPKNRECWAPQNRNGENSGEICKDILLDKWLLKKISKFAQDFSEIHLLSYSTSQQFLVLAAELQKRGLNIKTPQAPDPENFWTVNFFGSKTGIRQLIPQHMAPGKITSGLHNSASLGASMFAHDGGVVLKTHKGHAGAGVLIVGPHSTAPNYQAAYTHILQELQKDAYWQSFPIVVEQYIQIDEKIGGGSPTTEFCILPDGKIKYLYSGGMRVTPEGTFKGMEIGHNALPTRIEKEMIKIGRQVAKKYSQAGYRGYFDIDFVVDTKGKVFITESNVRRTGGTHCYHLALSLLGAKFPEKSYIFSNNLYPLPNKSASSNKSVKNFTQLEKKLQPILFDRQTGEGLIIASSTVLKIRKFGYVIIGKTKKRAQLIEQKMEELLRG